MQVSLEGVHVDVIVGFSERACQLARRRHGAYAIVLTWDEFRAWGLGVAEVPEAERHERMAEALRHFGERQGLAVQFFR